MKWDCPKKKASDARKTASRDQQVCYNCNESGHFKRDCPHLPPRARKQGFTNDAKGTSTGIPAASKSPVGGFDARSGVELEEKRSRNGELEGKHIRDEEGKCCENAEPEEKHTRDRAELRKKRTRSGTEPGELENKRTGVVAVPTHGLQARTPVGGKVEACQGQDESVKSQVPSSAIRIVGFSDMGCGRSDVECGSADMECGQSDVECGKTDTGCGEVTGNGSACSSEHEVEVKSRWCEVVKKKSTGRHVQKQPSQVPSLGADSKAYGHDQKQSLPISARRGERELSDEQIMSLFSIAAEKDGKQTQSFPSFEAEKERSDARSAGMGRDNFEKERSSVSSSLKLVEAEKEWNGAGYSHQRQSVLAGKERGHFEKEKSDAGNSLRQAEKERSDADQKQSVPARKGRNSIEKEIGHSPRQPLPLFKESAGRCVQRQSFEANKERPSAVQRKPLPPFVDTHCHLEYVFERYEHQGSFANFRNKWNYPKNFDGCIASFCDPAAFSSLGIWSQLLSEEDSGVWASFGIHPHNAKYYHSRGLEEKLLKCMEHEKCVAFGEIGLDYGAHSPSLPDVQRSILVHQLQLGVILGKPLVLHCRDAEDDLLKILSTHVPSEYKIHLHCFTGKPDAAFQFLEQYPNLFIGVTGSVTYERSWNVRAVAQQVPLERLLVETDAPYNTPCNLPRAGRCRFSHPAHAYYAAKEIANLKKVELWEVLQQLRENTTKLYGI